MDDTRRTTGVKHFSGTATYTKTLQADAAWFRPGASLVLDLGVVKEIAEVSVNGTPVGLLWRPPFRADVTEGAAAGRRTRSRSRSPTCGRTG